MKSKNYFCDLAFESSKIERIIFSYETFTEWGSYTECNQITPFWV